MSGELTLRQAWAGDSEAIARIQVEGWHTAYADIFPEEVLAAFTVELRRARWQEYLTEPDDTQTWLAERGPEAVGFCSFGPCRDSDKGADSWEIWALYVAPGAWRSGVGEALTRRALKVARRLGKDEMTLWVLQENERGRRFYEAMGFETDGVTTTYEKGGESFPEVRYVYSLELNPEGS